jgi:small subunit ribosomal protein S4
MPKRKHKKYSRPRKMYDLATIKEENKLMKKYGLKSRREVWKASYSIEKIRNLAKQLITAEEKDKALFLKKYSEMGFNIKTIADVLGLTKEDYLKRRLQSILAAKGITSTPNQARQFITHKHVKINGCYINSPGHITSVEEENNMELTLKLAKKEKMTEEEKQFLNKMKKSSEENSEEKD